MARRDDALNHEIALEIGTGQVDDAIRTMTTHAFAVAEGENLNVAEHWTEAHILRARTEIQAQAFREALCPISMPPPPSRRTCLWVSGSGWRQRSLCSGTGLLDRRRP